MSESVDNFHLNHVGYKEKKASMSLLVKESFHLNHVGYKESINKINKLN